MKTRYSSLVTLKKSTMQKSERTLQSANSDLSKANEALKLSYTSLNDLETPTGGTITELLASRTLLNSQREEIQHNKGWVDYVQNQIIQAKEKLKSDMIEYEKFKYLELQEIKKILKKQEIQDAKDLDEVALMTHAKKKGKL